MYDLNNSILQEVQCAAANIVNSRVFIKRDDLIDPIVSGNKWRKLKYIIEQALLKKSETLITFGGAFSNHLIATAAAAQKAGFKSIGFVRGEELAEKLNHVLRKCADFGMKLEFLSRDEYLMRDDASYKADLNARFPNAFIIPEGGAMYYGMAGCSEIWKELPKTIDHLFVSAGTGTTAGGLLLGIPEKAHLHVVSALKGDFQKKQILELYKYAFLDSEIVDELLAKTHFYENAHFGGYAKRPQELIDAKKIIEAESGVQFDHVYTAKAYIAMNEAITKDKSLHNASICFLHTGGLFTDQSY